jgi:hypothetical protein
MTKYKKNDGSDNGNAKGFQTVINEYKSVADVGREAADKVRVSKGRIGLNEYWGQDGQLKSFPQLNTNFINRVQAGEEFSPRAEFEVEVVIKNVLPEFKGEDETGRAIVNAYIPLYGGKVIPFKFTIGEDGAEYVTDNYTPGATTLIYGNIVNFKEKKVVTESGGFGKPREKVTYTTVREYLITGGNEPYEQDEEETKAYNTEAIKKALTEREVYLEQLKNKKNETKQETKPASKTSGFGTKPAEKKIKITSDDLPF